MYPAATEKMTAYCNTRRRCAPSVGRRQIRANLAKADDPRADASSSATKIPWRQEFLDGEWGS